MDSERKSVEIYLRIKGPLNPIIKPQFKLLADDTKIRFKQNQQTEEQEIVNQFKGLGVYRFEKIFREDSLQEDIYRRVAQDLVQSAIQGYNGTIFAYGQTGSGKTYTMTGGDDDPSQMGIIPRVINDVYKQAEIRQQQISMKLRYMQIYKKHAYDLLHPDSKTKKLEQLPKVHIFCKADNFQFQNLTQRQVPTFQQAMRVYEYGDKNRIICKTPSNDQSSRSHCILMIMIRTKNKDTGLQQKATINLVDLAGSERVHHSQMQEKQAKQGISINLGLHFLSRVVLSLAEQSRGNKDIYIPYRDSLLTMALKSSMGGNCKTRMIATINPNPLVNPQNIATCKFSQNLLAIQNKIKKNQFINPWDIIKGLKNQVQQLKGQISRLKGQNVKQILQRADYIQIHKMVERFITTDQSAATLPINDRLYIREYLSYMKSLIRAKIKPKGVNSNQQNGQQNMIGYEAKISEDYIIQMKNLRQQIQQKQNQIQLLLTLINHKRDQNNEDMQDNMIPIEQVSQQKIAQTVVNTLTKDNKRKSMNITVEDVEKHLIKPIILNKQESVEQAFKKFRDAHVKSEDIDEKQHQIKLKNMKKDVLQKKIKNLKFQRNKLNQRLQQLKSRLEIRSNENKANNLPCLGSQQNKQKSQFSTLQDQIKGTKQQITEINAKIKKKYQQLRAFQLQINRLSLCKNKNSQRLKYQFQQYIQDQSHYSGTFSYKQKGSDNPEKIQRMHTSQKQKQKSDKDSDQFGDFEVRDEQIKNIFGLNCNQKQTLEQYKNHKSTQPNSPPNVNTQKQKSSQTNMERVATKKIIKSDTLINNNLQQNGSAKTIINGYVGTNQSRRTAQEMGNKKSNLNSKLGDKEKIKTETDLNSTVRARQTRMQNQQKKQNMNTNQLNRQIDRHMQQFFSARKQLLQKIKSN